MTTPTLRAAALAVCLTAAPLPALGAGSSSVTLSPTCITKTGAGLFFMEYVDDCAGAPRHCQNRRWAWAAAKPGGGWEFESVGDAVLDDAAAPESNVQSMRQLFKGPSAHTCVSYLRVARVRAPDLPDSDSYFEYAVEGGALVLYWGAQQLALPAEAKLFRAAWGKDGPRAEAKTLDAGLTVYASSLAGKKVAARMVPSVELTVGSDTLLGFPEPGAEPDKGFLVLLVPQARLRELQAQLLHRDAKALLEKASGDLLAVSRAAGLLDAALQLSPGLSDARYDYARLFAQQGEAPAAARELAQLKGNRELRARIDADKAFAAVKAKAPVKKVLDAMQ